MPFRLGLISAFGLWPGMDVCKTYQEVGTFLARQRAETAGVPIKGPALRFMAKEKRYIRTI
jgi:hypothetical protein